jgi:hypothetical protein
VALYRDGRQAEALDAFGRLRRVLDEDLGVVPGADLRRVQQAILEQSSGLGWHPRLRDAAGPAGYFGRGPEMSRLLACLEKAAAGRGGVVLLAGEPGIGKSPRAAAAYRPGPGWPGPCSHRSLCRGCVGAALRSFRRGDCRVRRNG